MTEIFLDTETTGLSYKDNHKIVELKDLSQPKMYFIRLLIQKEMFLMMLLKYTVFLQSF